MVLSIAMKTSDSPDHKKKELLLKRYTRHMRSYASYIITTTTTNKNDKIKN